MSFSPEFAAHIASGATTLCHAWAITRRDGTRHGFTDHDRALSFEELEFRPESGLSALALQRGTGLSVDNTEAIGALTDAALSEEDILAGRFDGAEIRAWRVNWADPACRALMFRGHLGELRRVDGQFHAEVQGLAAGLNQPMGRAYHKTCSGVPEGLGFGPDLEVPGYRVTAKVREVAGHILRFDPMPGVAPGWFTRGSAEGLSGGAEGVRVPVREDRITDDAREIVLWSAMPGLVPGDQLRLTVGCDGTAADWKARFGSLLDFPAFPFLPDEDWLTSGPAR